VQKSYYANQANSQNIQNANAALLSALDPAAASNVARMSALTNIMQGQAGIYTGSLFFIPGATVTSGGAANAFQYQLLKQDLLFREASSVFTENGSLSQEAINGSRQIIAPADLINPRIPNGFGKFSTGTFNSPSGPAQVHFYMNPQTGEVFQNLDYKTVFNTSFGSR